MKKIALFLIVINTLFSCNSKENLKVTGKIKGLQKGTVYLQKVKDTVLVKVDSMVLNGSNSFSLSDNIASPQIYFLTLAATDKTLQFFAEKGKINIITSLDKFGYNPIVAGSKNHKLYEKYKETMGKFNNQNLDLLKQKFDFIKLGDKKKAETIQKRISSIPKRKYIYTLNFAVNNANFEIAPYLALSELYNIKPKLLDTIVKSMSPKVKKSLYGKKLISFLKEVKTDKKEETKQTK